jgi:hypothetical protein
MWTLIVTTFVFAGSVAGGVAVNTAFLDFQDEAKCRKAAAAMNTSEAKPNGSASDKSGKHQHDITSRTRLTRQSSMVARFLSQKFHYGNVGRPTCRALVQARSSGPQRSPELRQQSHAIAAGSEAVRQLRHASGHTRPCATC